MSLVLPAHPSCRQIVELVTSYLEGAMSPDERDHFEMHLATCAACVTYHQQILATREVASALRDEPVAADTMTALLSVFEAWKGGRG